MTYLHERLSSGRYDRAAAHRADTAWIEEHWADPTSRVVVLAGTRIRPVDGAIEWIAPEDAPAGARMMLGVRDGIAYFAVVTTELAATEAHLPLRSLLLTLSEEDAPLVLHAVGLAEWMSATRFCARCGLPLDPAKEGHELVCGHGHTTFPRTDPAVIMLITHGEPGTDEEQCLLGRQKAWPVGRFSTLAGFCEPGESLEDAVRREVFEETGVVVDEVTYFGNQPWPLPASLMLGFTGRATSTEIHCDEDEIEDARWLTRAELRAGAQSGDLVLPGGVSISRSLIESWLGESLPGSW
ncbi:NAD(+) diphosphatase [Nocardioides nematodiphilus]|uniref:NAD(+) diphosphatase n=1 Tax=Nocardioides nematodiphilus TaxID=2849669 RepID=UPI001CDA417A|nr:NAD(+) diphosphatase [Nocardioides nematodiphilus]MCA1984576.1 NAD(+) diphosphatase [Nocardioides nematodiphilus]